MASRNFDASAEPRALETALGLAVGTAYFVQNVSTFATLRLRSAAVKPAAIMRAHVIQAGGDITIEPQMSVMIWAWTDDPGCCACIVTEAPG